MLKQNNAKKESVKTVFYWNGIIDPKGLASAYDKTLRKLLDGDYQGLNLEKLVGHNVYSVRLNDSDRLLVTRIMVQGKPYLMVLDVVLNHDYAKSRFLKPGVLKNYMDVHGKAIAEQIVFEACPSDTVLLPGSKSSEDIIQLARIDFHKQKFIVFDDTQIDAATKKSLPLIIRGAPGSGKSCIALLIFGQYVESNGDEDYPILYVTESEQLANSMRCSWSSLPIAQNLPDQAVQFKSYQQLITTLYPDNANKTFVNKEHCKTWLVDYIKNNRVRSKVTGTTPDSVLNDTDAIYQEFRIISGCSTYEAYEGLGERQSLFHKLADKKWLFEAYTRYQKQLNQDDCIHAPFFPLNLKNKYKLIVVDEAQDLSLLQLADLADLTSNQQICFCEDNRQSLSDNKSKMPFLKQLMHSWNLHDREMTLSSSYRCPEAVINMANALSGIKSIVTGDGQPEIECPKGQTNTGKVIWLDSPSDEELSVLKKAAFFSDFAIITSSEYKAEAEELFNTDLVFTPEEIKGLEYKNILVYRPFDNDLFKEANKLIGSQSSEVIKKSTHRAKKGQGNEQYGPLFSSVFTAFTRPTDTLCIIQEIPGSLSNICDPLVKALPQTPTKLEVTTDSQNGEQDWFEEVKKLILNGNEDKAKAIYCKKFNKSDTEFMDLKTLLLGPEQPLNPVKIEIKPLVEPNSKQPNPKENNTTSKPSVKTPSVRTSTGTVIANSQNNLKPTPLDEIKALLKGRITLKILTKFLKGHDAKKYLYSIPLENGDCLFRALLYKDKSRMALFDFLSKNPESLTGTMITNTILSQPLLVHEKSPVSPLYYLLLDDKGPKILDTLCARNPKLAQEIDFNSICWFAAIKGDVPVIAELAKRKVNLNTSDNLGNTPIYAAAFNGYTKVIEILAKQNVDLNTPNKNGVTPAYIAAQNGHVSAIAELAKYGVDFNRPDIDGTTPAYIAAHNGHASVIAELAKYGANLNTPVKNFTPASIAACMGYDKVIAELAKYGVDLNTPDINGFTLAHFAAHNGHASVIAELAKHEVNLDTPNKQGETPVYLAAKNGHAHVIAELAKHSVDLNMPNNEGDSPAHIAARNGHGNVIEELEKYGVNLNEPNANGGTCAYVAAEKGYPDVIAVLAKLKANLDLPTHEGKTPAFIAVENGHIDVLEELAKHNVNLNTRDDDGCTPAYIAAVNLYDWVIDVLVKYNADLDIPDYEGKTPVFIAAENGDDFIVEVLAKYNADLDIPDDLGRTPAYIAAEYGCSDAIAVLAKYKANLNTPDQDGYTPAFIAAKNGHIDVIRELISAGVNSSQSYTISVQSLKEIVDMKESKISERLEQFISNQQKISNDSMSLSITPYDIAFIMGHEEIVKLLFPYQEVENKLTETAKVSSLGIFSAANQSEKSESDQMVSFKI